MNLRNISAWSIRNPVPSLVLFAALSIAGIVSFLRMDVNDNPDIEFPLVNVIVSQPGAAPTELETQVTQRIEAAVRGVNGVDEVQSRVSEGTSLTSVIFNIGVPVDRATNDVRNAIAQVRGNLPDGILEPQVELENIASGGPIAYYSAEATDMTLEQLSWYVDNVVTPAPPHRIGHGDGQSRRRRQPRDQGDPRSGAPAILRRHRSAGEQPAAPDQYQRRRRPRPDRGLRTSGARDRQRPGRVPARRAADRGRGGRTVRLSDLAEVRDFMPNSATFR